MKDGRLPLFMKKNFDYCHYWIIACTNRDTILSEFYHDHFLPMANAHKPGVIDSVNQIFTEFGLLVPSPPKDNKASPEGQVQAGRGSSGHVPDGDVP